MTVLEAPNVLTIALKRFQSGKFGKLNKPIRFPEILDLASFMSGTSDLPIYRLHGVVVHLDIMSASFLGHYVCYVKNFQSSWFKVDDSVAISFPDFFLVDILTSMAKVATIALLEADYICGSHSVAIPLVLVLPNLYGFNQCVSGSTKTLERKLLF
ncbi:ubiquitin carboxyl-terminal hydrolase 18-like [Glycine soja]|nr:ubiquitin carboxyl-terminal hydrolase 18-like [Glycine soja]